MKCLKKVIPSMSSEVFEKGDHVRVWSLQSFHGGGFLDGEDALVRQDQHGRSVILIVARKFPSFTDESIRGIDSSYEVYAQQIQLVRKGTQEDRTKVDDFLAINLKIRSVEQKKAFAAGEKHSTPYNYAPEFYFDEKMDIQLNRDLLKYPELFV